MKKIGKNIGLILIVLGTFVLAATRFGQLSHHNGMLLTGLACILSGIVLHIHSIKRDSLY